MKALLLKLLGISEKLFNFILPILKSESSKLLEQLLPIALGIVQQLATTQSLPNAKRDAAISQVKDAAIKAGIDASSSIVNAAVELALQNLKAGGN